MKNFFKKLKEYWKNPRSHAFMVIGLYFLFFGILYLMLQFPAVTKKPLSVEEQYARKDYYQYEMKIELKDQTYDLTGTRNYEKETFELEGNTYQVEEEAILNSNAEVVSTFQWKLFSPTYLSRFFEGTLNATTNYKDGSRMLEYEMDCNLWNSQSSGICQLQVTEIESKITKVKLIHSEQNYTVTIIYNDIQ